MRISCRREEEYAASCRGAQHILFGVLLRSCALLPALYDKVIQGYPSYSSSLNPSKAGLEEYAASFLAGVTPSFSARDARPQLRAP
jgi:hypothetical protein